jgi:hypothetical protein
VVQWSECVPSKHETRVRFPAVPSFYLRNLCSGSARAAACGEAGVQFPDSAKNSRKPNDRISSDTCLMRFGRWVSFFLLLCTCLMRFGRWVSFFLLLCIFSIVENRVIRRTGAMGSWLNRPERDNQWMTDGRMELSLWDAKNGPLRAFPVVLVKIVVSYIPIRPPFECSLPPKILIRPPAHSKKQNFADKLIGSSVYLLRNERSTLFRMPFLIVWSTVAQGDTFFGLILPSLQFNNAQMSLTFGSANDLTALGMPCSDCLMVFYDLDVAQRPPYPASLVDKPNANLAYSICKINSLNLARTHNRRRRVHGTSALLYPVIVAKLANKSLSPFGVPPFHQQIHPICLLAPAHHILWPWNPH